MPICTSLRPAPPASVRGWPKGIVRALFVFSALSFPLAPLAAQSVGTVRVEENLRAEPNGEVLGKVLPGLRLQVGEQRDRWLEVTLEGWVWLASLQTRSTGTYDLRVSAAEGENLRAEPRGAIVGQLNQGVLLTQQERIPGWARVRRTAWIWAPSVTLSTGSGPAASSAAAAPPAASRGGSSAAPPGASATPPRWLVSSPSGNPILASPDGDTLARSRPGTELRVLAREGSWVRVQVEGWVWAPESGGAPSGAGETVSAATQAQVAANPTGYRGRLVAWNLQFVALERAERVRTEFFEGEPFLLMRGEGGRFVYVAVPPERVQEMTRLAPLERFVVTGRVRAGASTLTGSPILDLVELERATR